MPYIWLSLLMLAGTADSILAAMLLCVLWLAAIEVIEFYKDMRDVYDEILYNRANTICLYQLTKEAHDNG